MSSQTKTKQSHDWISKERYDAEIGRLQAQLKETQTLTKHWEEQFNKSTNWAATLGNKIAGALETLNQFPEQFPLNTTQNGDWEHWHWNDIKKLLERLRSQLTGETTNEAV